MGRVAGLESPDFLDRFEVSIRSGVNFLLGFGVSEGGEVLGIELGDGSGVGREFGGCSLLLLNVVSTGSGTKRRLGAADSFPLALFVATSSTVSTSSFLLLRVVVSTGSGANRRLFFTVVSTGVGAKRRADGGGEVSGIMEMICCSFNDTELWS